MKFSILIANFNNSKYLDTAVQSVISQDFNNWEIVIVDDCSIDEFEEVVSSYRNDERIRVYRNDKNYGCGFTKKKCIMLAGGDILGFLDPDDALMPHALDIMHKEHLEFTEFSLICSTHFICDENLKPSRLADYTKALPEHTPYLLLGDGRIHHFASFKKTFYDKTVGLNAVNKKAVDQDLYYLLEETGPVKYIDQPLYLYRIHSNSISTAGKEGEATLWHYSIIQSACKRRIGLLKNNMQDSTMIKAYQSRYYKVSILKSYRKSQWPELFLFTLLFGFNGGIKNMLSYLRKIPRQGWPLIRRTFYYDHQIKVKV